ncbi:MAG: hypothetical protein R2770_18890 [Acidimicrobiales bacterium]
MTVLIHDPRPPASTALVDPAPRLATLDGAVIGLVHNTKTHGMELMEMVVEELRHRYDIAEVIKLSPGPGYLGSMETARPFAEQAMAIISAIGD